jgi:hypothetical protein
MAERDREMSRETYNFLAQDLMLSLRESLNKKRRFEVATVEDVQQEQRDDGTESEEE